MNDVPFEESFLTVAEVADLLRLNPQTVRNWIDAGSLPAVRIGRRVRIKKSDLDRVVENGYQNSPPSGSAATGPNATDFWGGEPVGIAEPAPEQEVRDPAPPGRLGGGGHLTDRDGRPSAEDDGSATAALTESPDAAHPGAGTLA